MAILSGQQTSSQVQIAPVARFDLCHWHVLVVRMESLYPIKVKSNDYYQHNGPNCPISDGHTPTPGKMSAGIIVCFHCPIVTNTIITGLVLVKQFGSHGQCKGSRLPLFGQLPISVFSYYMVGRTGHFSTIGGQQDSTVIIYRLLLSYTIIKYITIIY